MPVACQLKIRMARFLQKYLSSESLLCLLFRQNASSQLNELCAQYGKGVRSAAQLSDDHDFRICN